MFDVDVDNLMNERLRIEANDFAIIRAFPAIIPVRVGGVKLGHASVGRHGCE